MNEKTVNKSVRIEKVLHDAVIERISELDISFSEYVRLALLHSIKTLSTEQVGELKDWVLSFNPVQSALNYPVGIEKNKSKVKRKL